MMQSIFKEISRIYSKGEKPKGKIWKMILKLLIKIGFSFVQ
ncbi:hypothetical protein AND4_17509 [Vibrio sp. AND4]|nr:hypothetical protein AND4_17509 [Vibrio sp. AND4]